MEINKFNQTMKYLTRPAERPGQSLEDLTVTTDLPEEGMEFQSVIEGFGEGLDRNERQDFDKGGVVEREELFQGGPLDPKIKKQIRAYLKENNVKPDFKSYKFGVPKKHPLYDNARYFQRGESQRAYKKERGKDPKFRKQKAQYQKKYYSTNREEVLQKAKEYYANPDVAERVRQRQNNYYLTAKGKEKAKQALTKRIGEIGFFPPGGNYRENVWYDLYRSTIAKDGGRFVLDEKSMPKKIPMTKDGAINWAKDGLYKKIKFIDKQTNKKISLNTMDKYLDSTFGKGTYDKAIDSYKEKDALKDIKIKYKGKEQRIGTITRDLYPGNVLSAFEVHHPEGVGKNWWSSQLTFRDANQQVRAIEGDLIRGSKLAKTKDAKQALIKKQVKKLVNLPGGINFIFEGEILGKAPTKKSVLKASAEVLKDPSYTRQINKLLAKPTQLYSGLAALPEMGRIGKEMITQDVPKFGRFAGQVAKGAGKVARVLVGPVELPVSIAAGGLYANYQNQLDFAKALDRTNLSENQKKDFKNKFRRAEIGVDVGVGEEILVDTMGTESDIIGGIKDPDKIDQYQKVAFDYIKNERDQQFADLEDERRDAALIEKDELF